VTAFRKESQHEDRTGEYGMKIKVNWDLCEANALCMQAAPELFKVDDEDMLHVLNEGDVPENLRTKLEKAVRACPRAALSIEE